ncbi:hypothetical protein G6046_15405, partial [Bacillus amyloliquefaciens]|nr:hypothetical protein [Bacillus amyloliquefaciens]
VRVASSSRASLESLERAVQSFGTAFDRIFEQAQDRDMPRERSSELLQGVDV